MVDLYTCVRGFCEYVRDHLEMKHLEIMEISIILN